MASSLPWFPSALALAAAFALASLLSGVTYWLAHHPSAYVRWMRVLFSGVATLLMLFVLVEYVNDGSGRPAFLVLLIVVGASAVQATIEGTLDSETLTLKQRFVRSFFSYVWAAAIVCCLIGFLIFGNDAWPLHRFIDTWLAYRLAETISGYALGFLTAPIAISFYRRMLQSLVLRPGLDRALRGDERAH